ncbi:MAG: RNA polymerase sigma factor [Alphaproteobacteria bacterium]|nr:RNA polymerase sigma factor [Alphaproteobacteria bacterium]MCK5623154.1 RNA polymerase sigma factor [Alphaproteobacteria bacterium]
MIALLPRLRRFARGLTGSEVEADDLVQAACERAIQRIGQWQPGTRLDSWMFRIMQNLWIDAIRMGKLRGSHLSVVDPEGYQAPGMDGEQATMNRLTLEAVRRGVQRLPPDQRSVLLLVCVEGHSYRETADTLGIPVGTVMSRLSRARLALNRMVGGPDSEVAAASGREA